MVSKPINRSVTEMDADKIYSNWLFKQNITNTDLIDLGTESFKSMGTFSLSITAKLINPAVAPTSIRINFNKIIDGIQVKGTPYFIDILAADIVENPTRTIVNVTELTPTTIFTDLNITAQSTDNTNVDIEVRVTGD